MNSLVFLASSAVIAPAYAFSVCGVNFPSTTEHLSVISGMGCVGGPIPDLSSLGALKKLILTHDQLTGTVPSLPGTLEEVNLSDNFLTDLPDLSGNGNLVKFLANRNHLKGPVPDVSSLTALTKLELTSNKFKGTIPDFLTTEGCPLEVLFLNKNQLSGDLPAFHSTALKQLSLSKNLLQGTIPRPMVHSGLTRLGLNNNMLVGAIPDLQAELPLLTIATFAGNTWKCDLPNAMYDYSWVSTNDYDGQCFQYCPDVDSSVDPDGLQLVETAPGHYLEFECDNNADGKMTKRCGLDGEWDASLDRSRCIDSVCSQLAGVALPTPMANGAGECATACDGNVLCRGFTHTNNEDPQPDTCELFSSTYVNDFSVSALSGEDHCENWTGFAYDTQLSEVVAIAGDNGPEPATALDCCSKCLGVNECKAWNFDDTTCTLFSSVGTSVPVSAPTSVHVCGFATRVSV